MEWEAAHSHLCKYGEGVDRLQITCLCLFSASSSWAEVIFSSSSFFPYFLQQPWREKEAAGVAILFQLPAKGSELPVECQARKRSAWGAHLFTAHQPA